MSPEQVLAHFDRMSEAPGAIPRLRQCILDLAMRGKLVEQEPNDEPARELLKRIQVEKAARNLKEKVKPARSDASFDEEPIAFPLPDGWTRAPLAELTAVLNGRAYSKNELLDAGTPVLRVGNLFTSNHWYYSNLTLEEEKYCDQGDLLFAWSASFGPFIWPGPRVIYHYHIWKLSLHSESNLDKNYLYRFLLHKTQEIKDSGHGVSMLHMTKEKMERVTVPVPPFAEQHRIAAKVDELMALCDRLEAAQAERESRRNRLVVATHARLADVSASDSQPSTFFINHLPHITTHPQHIQQLRETILQLAVTGRLSEQRPADGDAELPSTRLGKKRRMQRKGSVVDSEEPAEPLPPLPETWAWAAVDDVAAEEENSITDGPFGANLKTAHYVETPGYRVIRLQNIARGQFRAEYRSYIDKDRFERLAKHRVFAGDLVVAGLVDPLVRCCEVPHDIGPALVKADCYRFKVHSTFSSRFALYYLNSPMCQRFAAVHHHGMTLVRIGLGNFRRIPIPVPPLAEQHRIVAKVDELMAMCDRLERQLNTAQTESRRLLEALLHRALAPARETVELETAA